MEKKTMIGTIAGGVVALVGGLATLGLDVQGYYPVTQNQHKDLAQIVYIDRIESLKNQLAGLKLEADKLRRSGLPVPEWLKNAIWNLEQQIDRLERQL